MSKATKIANRYITALSESYNLDNDDLARICEYLGYIVRELGQDDSALDSLYNLFNEMSND